MNTGFSNFGMRRFPGPNRITWASFKCATWVNVTSVAHAIERNWQSVSIHAADSAIRRSFTGARPRANHG